MSQERMTSAEFRALNTRGPVSATGSRPQTAPTEKTPNPYRGLKCVVCGVLVRSSDPADLCTTIGPGGETLSVTARHLGCKP